ncbi:hypothetical protein ACTXT7_006923 [Hymenolepis weldensis]
MILKPNYNCSFTVEETVEMVTALVDITSGGQKAAQCGLIGIFIIFGCGCVEVVSVIH